MKQEIINRIKQLGGDIANVKGVSLQDDLCAITFNTALYQKPEDTPWLSAEDTEPIMGLGNWVDENMELFNSDKETFYKIMVDTYYTLNKEPRGQLFWVAKPFTPFQKGTRDFEDWNDWFSDDDTDLAEIIQHSKCATPDFVGLLCTEGYPNYYYICLSDLKPDNPIVWSTDHETFLQK